MLDAPSLSSRILDMARAAAPRLGEAVGDPLTVDLKEAGLASVAAVRLMLEVEAAFDVEIPDSELTPENFATVANIETLVRRLKAAA